MAGLSEERALQIAKLYIDRNHDEMPQLTERRRIAMTKENDWLKKIVVDHIDDTYNHMIKPAVGFLANILMLVGNQDGVDIEKLTDDRYLEEAILDTMAATFNETSNHRDNGLIIIASHVNFFKENLISRAVELKRPEYIKQLNAITEKTLEEARIRQEKQAEAARAEGERKERIRRLEARVKELENQALRKDGGGNPPPPPPGYNYMR